MLSLCIAVLWVSTEVSEQLYICAGRGPTGLQHTEDRNGVSSCQEGVLEESSNTRVWDQVLWLLYIWIFFIGFIVDFCCGTENISAEFGLLCTPCVWCREISIRLLISLKILSDKT